MEARSPEEIYRDYVRARKRQRLRWVAAGLGGSFCSPWGDAARTYLLLDPRGEAGSPLPLVWVESDLRWRWIGGLRARGEEVDEWAIHRIDAFYGQHPSLDEGLAEMLWHRLRLQARRKGGPPSLRCVHRAGAGRGG